MKRKPNITGRLGRFSAQHPWRAIGIWIGFVLAVVAIGSAVGTTKLKAADAGSGSSGRAGVVADKAFTVQASEQVLVRTRTSTVDSASFRAAVTDVISRVQATGESTNMRSPYGAGNAGQISKDRRSALISFNVVGGYDNATKRIGRIEAAVSAASRDHPSVSIAEAGDASVGKAVDDTVTKDFQKAEKLSLPITLLVLLLTFGALVAAVLPLALAMTAIIGAGGLLAFASQLSPASGVSNSIILLIGLAVGVDYSLFYLKREREERAAGRSKAEALQAAAQTSGRSVLVSGVTVIIAMAGMLLSGNKVTYSIGLAAILVVAISVVGSLTVLPAMLSLLGDKVNRGRIPFLSRRVGRENRGWGWLLDRVMRRPVVATVVATAAMLALAAPVIGMKLASPGASDLPQSLPTVQTYNTIQHIFPGGPTPALMVVQAPDVTSAAVQAGIKRMEEVGYGRGVLNPPAYQQISVDKHVAMITVPLAGNGESSRSYQALQQLRRDIIPATIGAVSKVKVDVSGQTAISKDFTSMLRQRLPLVMLFVLILAFVFLLVSFRSVVIAGTSVLLNLLSVGAAYGVLVAVFQYGWGQSLLGFHSVGSITAWLPLFLFVVLFGLSMDYQVFILSRIRELYDRGHDTSDAIATGIKQTAGTVTAAAVVMVFVFLTFARLSQVSMKETGVGLATAILIDATVVRGVLLPAVMKLLGKWNWYVPRSLAWLPRISHGAELDTPHVVRAQEPAPAEGVVLAS